MAEHSSGTKSPFIGSPLYDFLKNASLIYLPAISTLYFALGTIWGFPNIEQVIGTIAALEIFLGGVLGISKAQYNRSGAAYSGTITTVPETNEIANLSLDATASELADKGTVTLKVNSQ